MAGDWIKMRTNLWDDPRVGRLVDMTGATDSQVIGSLYWLWASADQHTENGYMPGLTLRQIDRKTGTPGLGAALVEIGWLIDGTDGVTLVNFSEHNGTSAKRRCVDAQRKANERAIVRVQCGQDEDKIEKVSDDYGRNSELEEEREIERIQDTSAGAEVPASAMPSRVAPCPTDAIVSMYHDKLPMLPRVEVVSESRRRAVSARWREVISDPQIRKSAVPKTAAMEWFDWYFEHASKSNFLTGRAKDWRADFDFLMTPSKFAKVVEGHYHKGAKS